MASQDWHFRIKGELIYGKKFLHLHPENFINLIRISDYHNRLMPIILTRLQIDKNLFDYIIKNAETCQIKLTITKFMMSDDRLETSPEEIVINDIYQVSVGSDVNYNKELDYVEQRTSELPIQDKFRETYIGLVSKACLDANKFVVNETIKDSMMQDVVLSYLLGGNLHPLVEPFHHNEKLHQTIVPPMDTLFSAIDYMNNLKVFYDTKYVFFIDEPYVTYLISKSGKGVPMKGEKYNTTVLAMRNVVESKNLTIGMSNDGTTKAYQADISVLDSSYLIDKDTVKVINTIGAILNPSLDLSKVKDAAFKQIKDMLHQQKVNFMTNVLFKSKAVGDVALKLCHATSVMKNAVDRIKDATAQLNSLVQQNVNGIISQLPIGMKGITSAMDKSILKSVMDNHFISCDKNLDLQQDVRSNFAKVTDATATQQYKLDFLDNMVSCVTYVNLPDVSKQTEGAIGSLSAGVNSAIQAMTSTVTSHMGCFGNLSNSIGNISNQLASWQQALESMASGGTGSGSGSGSGTGGGANTQLIETIGEEIDNLTIMKGETDEYGTIAEHQHDQGQDVQSNLSSFANDFLSMIGDIGSAIDPNDIKSQFVTKQTPITFGNLDLGSIMQMTTGGCFGGTSNSSIGSAIGSIASMDIGSIAQQITGGRVTFSTLGDLKLNLAKFDLGQVGQLGIGHVAFNLNIGKIPGLGEISGTKLLKVRNDNPNELKNIKSELEISKNTLSFNKFGLDPFVFTPNKRYVIKNYSAHDNKDGIFILAHKIEVYTREDSTFICNTRLTFNKATEEASGDSGATNTSAPNANAPDGGKIS